MTKEKNDMTNEHNFKVGDRVMCTDDGNLGTITFVDIDEGKGINNGYEVKFDDGSEEWIMADMLTLSDELPYDRRTAFLMRLQSLLREFDAEIVFHCNYKQETLGTSIIVGESELRRNEVYGVTADNIMDFDKEGV